MSFPLFYIKEFIPGTSQLILDEDTSKHIILVLRMKQGERLQLTNGKGKIFTCEIISDQKKSAEVKILSISNIEHRTSNTAIAISLIKNNNRFEWFLEKATEIGVTEIIPLICQRTEKQHFRYDRMKNILVSAMLQSQQAWLPILHEPVKFTELIKNSSYQNKYIAHCTDDQKKQLSKEVIPQGDRLILIGPEGDFTKDEIDMAVQNNYIPAGLGETRLRTETAAIVAAVLLLNK